MRREMPETVLRNLLAAATPPAGPEGRIGKYELLREVGRGGMGVVYEAFDPDLRRRVALKLLIAGEEAEIARFEREARLVAGLSHQNIAAIYEVGEDQGRHFIAMQFVDGKTLAGADRSDRRLLVTLLRDAALAVQHAHEQGIVHRDVKPGNLMVEMRNGAPRVYVMDFGLAKHLAVKSSISRTGNILGTPSYMPPEQVKEDLGRVDARSDVYSLGATLYDLLAGRAPFEGGDVLGVLARVASEEPRPIRLTRPDVPRDLQTIALKCLEKAPSRRYGTAKELAEELTRWLNGEAILAHPPTVFYRLRKRIARRKALLGVGALGIAVALAFLVPWVIRERTKRAQAQQGLELWAQIAPLLGDAELYSRQGDVSRARAMLEEGVRACRPHTGEEANPLAWYFLGRLLHAQGKRDEAMSALDRALALDPSLGEAHFERGILLVEEIARRLSEGGEEREIQALRARAIEDLSVRVGKTSYFREVDGMYGRAELARLSGDLDRAEAEHARVLEREPLYARSIVGLANVAFQRGDYNAAANKARDATVMHHGLAEAYWVITVSCLRFRDMDLDPSLDANVLNTALEAVEDAIRLGEDSADAYRTRASLRLEKKQADGALEDLARTLSLRPADPVALDLRGEARRAKGDYASAIADHSAALEARPRFASALAHRGVAHAAKGDLAAAERDFAEALTLDEKDARTWLARGEARLQAGRLADAIDDLGHAVSLRSKCLKGYLLRAQTRLKSGDAAGAGEDAQEALKLQEESVEAHLLLADSLRARRNMGEALPEYARALQLDPENAHAWEGKAYWMFKYENFPQAVEDATRALRLDEGLIEALCTRGKARLAWQGHEAEAIADLDQVLRVRAGDPEVWTDRGEAKLKTGDRDGAIADFGKAIDLAPDYLGARLGRARARDAKGDAAGAIEDLTRLLEKAPLKWPPREEAEMLLARLQAGAPK